MEISGRISPIKIGAYLNNIKEKDKISAPTAHTSEAAAKRDKVELSQTVREVNKAREELASIPDIRAEKVDEIKRQIDDGTYKIDGNKIAFNMIRQSLIDEIA
jgi:negative regulator of flagellin synthesis FlgM